MPKRRTKGEGTTRQLPSGRWQARFYGPDGVRHSAPVTFDTRLDAAAWLRAQAGDVDRGLWQAPTSTPKVGTFGGYAAGWLAGRELKPRTRAHYQRLLDRLILPNLGDAPLDRVTPATVRAWYAEVSPDAPTLRAHAYALLRTIFATAVSEDLIVANPCRIRSGGSSRTKHRPKVATLPELEVIVAAMPARLRAMVLLAAWCGLRFGELAELRRGDVDLAAGVLRISRGVARADGEVIVGDPKSEAGIRTVSIPPHLLPVLEEHLAEHVRPGAAALLFPAVNGGHLAPSTLYGSFYPAREAAGRRDLRFHDLRHTGATLAAATGATLADLMARLGHSTPAAALRYQHAAADRDRAIAEALSGFADAKVVSLRPV
jgi:integrase